MPELPMFEGSNYFEVFEGDSTFQTIKYYAIISAIQSEDADRTIKLLNKIHSKPYVQNSTYKESDTYELLANEYVHAKDTASYLEVLNIGARKFPDNLYFTPNLINVYIVNNQMDKAIDYIDVAIKNDPANTCDLLSVKATIFAEKKDYEQASSIYEEALNIDPDCIRSLEGLGVLYILQAQDLKSAASNSNIRKEQAELDKQAADFYKLSLPYLEKLRAIQKDKAVDADIYKLTLSKLQNVYYNLNMNDEFEKVDALLNNN